MWVERIAAFMNVPGDLGLGTFPTKWTRPIDHVGGKGETPLKVALTAKRQGGLYALSSGVMIWAAARMGEMTDVTPLRDLALAQFFMQQHPAYYRHPDAIPDVNEINRTDKYEATVSFILKYFFDDWFFNRRDWPLYPNFAAVAEIITLCRYHMGPDRPAAFDGWVEGMIERISEIAAYPEARNLSFRIPPDLRPATRLATMGPAIPPQALDLSVDASRMDMREAWREFLTTVDWASNRFLNPPGAVHLPPGFGRPYEEPR